MLILGKSRRFVIDLLLRIGQLDEVCYSLVPISIFSCKFLSFAQYNTLCLSSFERNYSLINILCESYLENIEYIKSRECLFLSSSIAWWYIACIIFAYLPYTSRVLLSKITAAPIFATETLNMHGNKFPLQINVNLDQLLQC